MDAAKAERPIPILYFGPPNNRVNNCSIRNQQFE